MTSPSTKLVKFASWNHLNAALARVQDFLEGTDSTDPRWEAGLRIERTLAATGARTAFLRKDDIAAFQAELQG